MKKHLYLIFSISFLFSCTHENQFNSNYPNDLKLRSEIKSLYEWTFGLAFYGNDTLSLSTNYEFQYFHDNCDIDRREAAYYKFDSSLKLIESGSNDYYADDWIKTFFYGDTVKKRFSKTKTLVYIYHIDSIWNNDTLKIIKDCNFDHLDYITTIIHNNKGNQIEIIKEGLENSKLYLTWNKANQLVTKKVLIEDELSLKYFYQHNKQGFISKETCLIYSGLIADTLTRNFEYVYDKIGNWIVRTELWDDKVFEIKNREIEYK